MSKCIGFGEFEGKCSEDVDVTMSRHWCSRCETLRREHISKEFSLLANPSDSTAVIEKIEVKCESREFCTLRSCEDPENRWLNESNCTCRGCLTKSEDKKCELSGEAYNTDGDCLASK